MSIDIDAYKSHLDRKEKKNFTRYIMSHLYYFLLRQQNEIDDIFICFKIVDFEFFLFISDEKKIKNEENQRQQQ